MSELTLFDLKNSEGLVEDLSLQQSKFILGGQVTGGGSDDGGVSEKQKKQMKKDFKEYFERKERRERDRADSPYGR